MAVIEVTKMWSRRGASIVTQDNKKFTLAQSDTYQVMVELGTTIAQIVDHDDVPKVGDLLAGSDYIWCRNVTPTQISPLLWHVTASWEGERGKDKTSPLNDPPIIEWSDVETDEPVDEDWNGLPIVTVNGEPIQGVTMPVVDQVVTIKRNFAEITPYLLGAYRRATNSDTFLDWPPGTARLKQLSAVNVYDDALGYWAVTAQVQFRIPYRTTPDKAWYKRVRHEGLLIKTGDDRIIRAYDENNMPVTRPVLLNTDGTKQDDPSLATWLEFQVLDSLPYASLGLID